MKREQSQWPIDSMGELRERKQHDDFHSEHDVNQKDNLGLHGYDPVSYTREGPQKGDPAITADFIRSLILNDLNYLVSIK